MHAYKLRSIISQRFYLKSLDMLRGSKTPPIKRALLDIEREASLELNFIEGLGFLALPFALKTGGIVVMVAFFIIPICLWYTGKLLIECFYDKDEKERRVRARSTFKELGEVLSHRYGGYIVTVFVQLDLYLAPVSYLILCGSLMSHALPSVPLTVIAWTCIAGVAVFPTTFLKSLSDIAWLSVVSVIALISVLISVLWYGAKHMAEWDLDTILFWDSEGVSIGLSILIYGYGALPILPSVEESMREKHKFTLALALAYALTMVIKVVFFCLCVPFLWIRHKSSYP